MDCPYATAKFGDFSFSRFGFIMQTDRCGLSLYSHDYLLLCGPVLSSSNTVYTGV